MSIAGASADIVAGLLEKILRPSQSLERKAIQYLTQIGDSETAYARFGRALSDRLTNQIRSSANPVRRVTLGDHIGIEVDLRSYLVDLYLRRKDWEPVTTAWLRQNITPGMVFYDVGANLGYYTLVAAGLVGESGVVVGFEPNPVLAQKCQRDIAMNSLESRVSLYQIALSDREERAKLYIDQLPQNAGLLSSLLAREGHLELGTISRDEFVEVEVFPLDSVIEKYGLPDPDVIKIDVEGLEPQVMQGMSKLLKARVPQHVIVETSFTRPAMDLLSAAGYEGKPLEINERGFGNYLFSPKKRCG